MTATMEMERMDVICCEKTEMLTLNKSTIDKSLVEVFNRNVDKDILCLLTTTISKVENEDAIAIVGILADPKEALANIEDIYFLPFNLVDKRTMITYIHSNNGNWYRASKEAGEQILDLLDKKTEIAKRVLSIIDKFAQRWLLQ